MLGLFFSSFFFSFFFGGEAVSFSFNNIYLSTYDCHDHV